MFILKICDKLGLFYLTKLIFKKKLQILCYHGFECADETKFRPKLFISKATFAKRLAILKQAGFNIVDLDDAVKALDSNTLPDNSIVITIDDGFYNVFNIAAPMLAQYQFPSTLYLTTYYSIKQSAIFRLVVQYLFWKTNHSTLDLSILALEGFSETLNLTNANPQLTQQIANIYQYGEQHFNEAERVAFSHTLAKALNVDLKSVLDSRMLGLITLEEAKQLQTMGMDIQLHTHRHIFPQDDKSKAQQEILENRSVIESALTGDLKHFCYPSGQWHEKQWPWLKEVNITSATTCEGGFNSVNSPKLGLSRFLDGENISELEFKAEIYGFLEMMRMGRSLVRRFI